MNLQKIVNTQEPVKTYRTGLNKAKEIMENIKHEILNETYRPWVKKLGQWHLADDNGKTRCGVPMLGNNYAKYIPENERTKCDKCFE